MSSVSKVFRPLDKLSDLFFAIGDAIHAAGIGVSVANYEEWDGYVGDATVLIELERTSTSERQNDGRYAHSVTVTLHAVVARSRKFAALEAGNLATCLERLADLNRWGFRGLNCEVPCDLHSGPSMFQKGDDGYDAWGVTFRQVITPGLPIEEPRITGMPLVSWRLDDDSPRTEDEFAPLEGA